MSDYMFMLESHLSADQNRVVSLVQAAAAEANVSLFLTGGAMRDMLGGFPIRDLDFTVEGSGLKLAKAVAEKAGAKIVSADELRKSAELIFPGGVTAEIAMARRESYPRPGVRPHITPATIHEDLGGRDFTVDAIALSLNRASRGLLIDPTNGLGDLERKELRAVYNYALYDDPVRILRLVRLRVRLGFTVEEKTQAQYANVRAEGLESKIPPAALYQQLEQIAAEPNAAGIVEALSQEKLLGLFSPALETKLNLAALSKLEKAKQLVPFEIRFPLDPTPLFLFFLTEKLTPKEKVALAKATAMPRATVDHWHKLEANAKKLEKDLKSPKLNRPAQVYHALEKVPGEQVLFLLLRSSQRMVQDRIRNYLQKYLPMAKEVTEEEIRAKGGEPGTTKYRKAREELITARLNARPKKVVEAAPAPPKPPEPAPGVKRPLRQPLARG
jgi:tRNA nucleotidyltransferase (CCA-adding enzyme)